MELPPKDENGEETRHIEAATPNYTPHKYFFGSRGPPLVKGITLAGAIRFLLFGYDQGVFSVGWSSTANVIIS